jgi:hypothetical protein
MNIQFGFKHQLIFEILWLDHIRVALGLNAVNLNFIFLFSLLVEKTNLIMTILIIIIFRLIFYKL